MTDKIIRAACQCWARAPLHRGTRILSFAVPFSLPAVLAPCFLASMILLYGQPGTAGGALSGGASEWTQIANNSELVAILSKESQGVALNAQQLTTQVQSLTTQLNSYKNMLRNTANLPDTIWRDVSGSLKQLHSVMSEAQSLALTGGKLDGFLRSEMIADPFYKASGLNKAGFERRYDEWNLLSSSALNSTLAASRLTMDDVKTEADVLARIQQQGKTVGGQVEAIQIGNELAASVAHQLTKLRTITAAQNEQTAIFQARWTAQMDNDEALRRTTNARAQSLQLKEPAGKELIGSFTKGEGE